MSDVPSENQSTGTIKPGFRLKRREKRLVLVAAIVGLLAALFWRPVHQTVLTALVLRAEKPAATIVNELITHAKDPAALLERLWRTDKIPHRVLVMTYLKEHANADAALLGRLESILVAAAEDGDMEVRELALDALVARRHPELQRLALEQLSDVDPAARVLGLTHLRKVGDVRLVPIVVPLLDDPNPLVAVHAALALRNWTGEDFGVRLSQASRKFNDDQSDKSNPADAEALKQGVQRWKDWWKLHQQDYRVASIPPSQNACPWRLPAPDFSLQDLQGNSIRLSALRGKVVLINLWDTVTTNCLSDMPVLNQLQRENSSGLAVLAISLDSTADERSCCGDEHDHASHSHPKPSLGDIHVRVEQVVKTNGVTNPVLIDPTGSVGRRFIGDDLPTYILIDADGYIRRRFIGGRTRATLAAMIKEVTPTVQLK